MSHLFGTKLFNGFGSLLNGGNTAATVYTTDSVAFEGVSLNDGTNIVLTRHPLKGPSRSVLGGDIPRDDGQYMTGSYFRETEIILEGYLKAASKSAMATLIDSLCLTLSTQEGNLDIVEDDGTVKRFAATCVNYADQFAGRAFYHLTIVPFTLRFTCKVPFGKARGYTSYYTGLTTSGNQSVVNGGTYKSKPVFILNFSAASGVTAVEIENTTTGESITYTDPVAIAAGDILEFDAEMIRVRKNGVEADYGGTFPKLETGVNVIAVTVTGTSFQAGLTTKFRTTYIR
jgi:hypothetical protein